MPFLSEPHPGESFFAEFQDICELEGKSGVRTDNRKRRLVAEIWLYLKGIEQKEIGQYGNFSKSQFEHRKAVLAAALLGHYKPIRDNDLEWICEISSVGSVLDQHLAARGYFVLETTRRRRTSLVWTVDVLIPTAMSVTLVQRSSELPDSLPTRKRRVLPYDAIRWHKVIPPETSRGISLKVQRLPSDVDRNLFGIATNRGLDVFAGVFLDNCDLDISYREEYFEINGFRNKLQKSTRESSSDNLAKLAVNKHEVNAIVLPELTLTKDLQDRYVDMVLKEVKSQPARRALLVIPGSFHQDAGRIKKNSSSIYLVDSASATPMELFQHEKLIPGNIGIYAERILVGNTITMLSTSRGVLCVMICMDFCDNKGQTKDGIWPDLEADFVLVPSYGNDNTLTLHINRARDQHLERGTQVVVAQQMLFGLNSTQVREAKDVGTGQVATAVQGDDTDPASATKNPTRAAIFYRSGTEAHPFLKTTADPPFEILSLDN